MRARAFGGSVLFCVLIASAVAAGCGGHGVPVQSPVAVQSGRTVEQTEQAILEVLPRRGWAAESVQPGRVVAFLSIRKHLLRVDIRYDPQQVSLYYVDSDNLSAHIEANGQVYAHGNVNRWIQQLAKDISAALAVLPQPGTTPGATPSMPTAPSQPAPLAAPAVPLTGPGTAPPAPPPAPGY